MIGGFPRVIPGQKIDMELAEALNRAFQELQRLANLTTAPGALNLERGVGGYHLGLDSSQLTGVTGDHSARCESNAIANFPNAAWTTVTFGTRTYDTDNFMNSAFNPTQITIPTTGKYLVLANSDSGPAFIGNANITSFGLWITNNGTGSDGFQNIVLVPPNLTVTHGLVPKVTAALLGVCNSGDTLNVKAWQDTGAPATITVQWWSIQRLA